MELLRDTGVKGEHPQAERQLVLDLEVDPAAQHGHDELVYGLLSQEWLGNQSGN